MPPPLLSAMLLLTVGGAASAQNPGSWVLVPKLSSVTGTITRTIHGFEEDVLPNAYDASGDYYADVSDPDTLYSEEFGVSSQWPAYNPLYEASVLISGARTYTYVFRWLDSDGYTALDPPKNASFELHAETGVGNYFANGLALKFAGSVSNGIGDVQQDSTVGGYAKIANGDHFITMDGSSGQVTITRMLSLSLSTSDMGEVDGHARLTFHAKPSNRGVIVTPQGHEQTYQRVLSGAMGPYQVPAAVRQLNVVQNGNTMRADIGLLYSVFGLNGIDPGSGTTSIDYEAQIFGQNTDTDENRGDAYTWNFSHPARSDSGNLPSFIHEYGIALQEQTYTNPQEYYAPSNPLSITPNDAPVKITKNDAGQTDNVDFTYTFVKDNITADYHLQMNLHQQFENWVEGNPTILPVTDVALSQNWFPVKTTQIVTPTEQEFFSTVSADVSNGATVLSALLGKDPRIGAIIATIGLAANAAAPKPQSYSDNDSEFSSAIAEQNSGADTGRFSAGDAAFFASINVNDPANVAEKHGECEWQLFIKTYPRIRHYVGDEYAADGFAGQVQAHLSDPISQTPHNHYRRKPKPNPLVPSAPILNGSLNFQSIASNAAPQSVTFTFRAGDGSPDTAITILVPASGEFSLIGFPAAAGVLNVKPDMYLAVNIPLDLSSGDVSGVGGSFAGGDANNDNSVDSSDFGVLIGAFNSDANVPGSGYDPHADFNGDGSVDSTDFGILIGNFNQQGAP